ncbi:MAG: glycosyltransferase [Flavobacteriia bacterium]|jgi:glycosyltransferase involved in cell wall biosynthesis
MNVLFIASWYPNKETPTNGNFIQKHAQAVALIHNVQLITFVPTLSVNEIQIEHKVVENVAEYIIYYPKIISKILIYKQGKQLLSQYKAITKVLKLIDSKKIDICHLNVCLPYGIWAYYLKRKFKIPYVLSEHSSAFHRKINGFSFLQKKLATFLLRRAAHILPVSEDLAIHLRKLAPNNNYTIVSNVVDENIFKLKNNSKQKSHKFVHISNAVESAKNILGIIKVIHEISHHRSDFQIDIVSDGDFKYAKEFAENLGILDRFINFKSTQTTEEIADTLQDSLALILFSNYENFPCVIPEAWMSGIPVIATSVNGIPEHVNSSNGILVQKNDEKALENAILKILDEKISFDVNNIRAYALKNFSYKHVGEQISQIYFRTLKK